MKKEMSNQFQQMIDCENDLKAKHSTQPSEKSGVKVFSFYCVAICRMYTVFVPADLQSGIAIYRTECKGS
jgi:hypothetical protein